MLINKYQEVPRSTKKYPMDEDKGNEYSPKQRRFWESPLLKLWVSCRIMTTFVIWSLLKDNYKEHETWPVNLFYQRGKCYLGWCLEALLHISVLQQCFTTTINVNPMSMDLNSPYKMFHLLCCRSFRSKTFVIIWSNGIKIIWSKSSVSVKNKNI